MYTIRQVAEMTEFSPDTLRYYEKLGFLKPLRKEPGGVRLYSDDNVHLLKSLKCLKKTGLSLEEIKEFFQEGQICIHRSPVRDEEAATISGRINILSEHLSKMEEQRRELEEIIKDTKRKLYFYHELMK
ncbi:MerR family transcriptional regulator [Paenibacillus piri]|uniref:MerR family transcriptional regulator n=1 Tax=Paenibacillus piri TaxID=2547395 RepID=A0A4R5KL13_9BACL|nr:MerR family transcriptional regulator [Paenibacillus piri]